MHVQNIKKSFQTKAILTFTVTNTKLSLITFKVKHSLSFAVFPLKVHKGLVHLVLSSLQSHVQMYSL